MSFRPRHGAEPWEVYVVEGDGDRLESDREQTSPVSCCVDGLTDPGSDDGRRPELTQGTGCCWRRARPPGLLSPATLADTSR